MPIVGFASRKQRALVLSVEPSGHRIETMFVDCFGQAEVDVDEFHRVTRRPFDPAPADQEQVS